MTLVAVVFYDLLFLTHSEIQIHHEIVHNETSSDIRYDRLFRFETVRFVCGYRVNVILIDVKRDYFQLALFGFFFYEFHDASSDAPSLKIFIDVILSMKIFFSSEIYAKYPTASPDTSII